MKHSSHWIIRGSLSKHWHPPSRTKTKDLFINLRFKYVRVFTVGVEFFFRPFEPRPEERKKVNFWREPQRRPYSIINSLIAWLNEYSWHQLSTIAQPWTAPVSVLEHSWPTFSLFLPVQCSLFTLLWAEFWISSSVKNAQGVSITLEWPSYSTQWSLRHLLLARLSWASGPGTLATYNIPVENRFRKCFGIQDGWKTMWRRLSPCSRTRLSGLRGGVAGGPAGGGRASGRSSRWTWCHSYSWACPLGREFSTAAAPSRSCRWEFSCWAGQTDCLRDVNEGKSIWGTTNTTHLLCFHTLLKI